MDRKLVACDMISGKTYIGHASEQHVSDSLLKPLTPISHSLELEQYVMITTPNLRGQLGSHFRDKYKAYKDSEDKGSVFINPRNVTAVHMLGKLEEKADEKAAETQ